MHRRSQGGASGAMPPKFLEYIVILCFERRYPIQNTVASQKSRILHHPIFRAGYATGAWLSYEQNELNSATDCLYPKLLLLLQQRSKLASVDITSTDFVGPATDNPIILYFH